MPHRAIEELQQHGAALRRLARDLVGASQADDVLQDAAVEVLRSPPPAAGPLFGWLRTVVRRVAGRRRRGEARRRWHEAAAAGERTFTELGAEAADTLRVLTGWLTSLPEPYRSTLLARYLRERTPNEIAAETGVPVRTVKTQLQRGLQLLRQRADEDGGDWRGAIAVAFGLELTTGILMTTATKVVLAAGVLLVAGLAVWQFAAPSPANAPSQQAATMPANVVTPTRIDAPIAEPAREPASPAPARPDATPPPPAIERAAADQIVVRVVDAASGEPVVAYGIREHMVPTASLGAKEFPLQHAGEHTEGRLVLQASAMEQRAFVIEDVAGRYLPSTWFAASHAVDRDGERTIEVRLPAPLEVTVRVLRERSGEPVAGTEVELLRPWLVPHPITLKTKPLPTERFRAQTDDNTMILNFLGGRALLLGSGRTDAGGRVRLRVPPGEPLALRLLGPGHQPVVRSPWSVSTAPAADVVETVTVGAALQVRVLPASGLDALRVAELDVHTAWANQYRIGVRLRHVQSGEHRPEDGGLYSGPIPLAADGTCRVDGLPAGDWEVRICYPWRTGSAQPQTSDTGIVEMPLPIVTGLADLELRVVDVDVSGWACGKLDATITRDGALLASGGIIAYVIGATGSPQPRLTRHGTLILGKDSHVAATLPPARYFAQWTDDRHREFVPLGVFTIRAGETTRIDFVTDIVPAQVRVFEHDGATPGAGRVTLTRAGPLWHGLADASGLATFPTLLRGDVLQVAFHRATGTTSFGQPDYGPPIDLGTLRADGSGEAVVLRLPAR